jgi:GT2 family glycosyltransferase
LGFAGGCNVGIRQSDGEFVALVNSDSALRQDWMMEMVRGISVSPKVGMCACKIYFWKHEGYLENMGQTISRDGFGRTRGRLEKDIGQYDKHRAVFCPSGCAALYRRKMLDECGLFDEKFFAYADDIDIGLRGRLMGYLCHCVATAVAYHRLSASFGLLSPLKAFLLERNRLWVVIKCYPLPHLLASPFHTLARYFFHFIGIFQKKGPAAQYVKKISIFSLAWIMVKVYLSTIYHLPHLLRERYVIQKRSKASARRFELWMKRYGINAKETALNELSFAE